MTVLFVCFPIFFFKKVKLELKSDPGCLALPCLQSGEPPRKFHLTSRFNL